MDLETAKTLLNDCLRTELRDHAFGDVEVFWFKGWQEIAMGYFGSHHSSVVLGPKIEFTADDALALRECGTLGHVERNDETGADEFKLGETLPGLTKDAVFDEITRPRIGHCGDWDL